MKIVYEKMSENCEQDDLMASDNAEGKLRLELRKLSNSDGWVSSSHPYSSTSNSRASTPLSQKSTGRRLTSLPSHSISKRGSLAQGNSLRAKQVQKPKKFQMVLEKDDDYEVDYLTPDEGDSSSSSVYKESVSNNSISDDEFSDQEQLLTNDSPDSSWQEGESSDQIEEVPKLSLPKSSNDLLLSNDLVLQALSVYEVLRHFRNTLRLSPFLFEDFCAALESNETTVLINECHIMLLKNLLKEEENLGVLFAPIDQKDAYNASLYFVDYLTWPEVLRNYVQSSQEFRNILAIVEEENFPCVEVSKKIKVLQFLTDLFLSSTKIRDELMMDGSIRYDDHCRVCHRLGDLLCCETCPAVYHLACCNPPLKEVPEEEWQCEVCLAHKLNGVSNCEMENEFTSQYLRHEPIGVDRHGRKYWFLVRRLFIESEDEIFYYTTYNEFKWVLSRLDHEKYEMVLCEALKDVLDEFPRLATITEELTNEAKWKDDSATQIQIQKENALASMEEEKLKESKSDVDAVKESKEKEEDKKEVEEKKDVDKHGGDVCETVTTKVSDVKQEAVPVSSSPSVSTTQTPPVSLTPVRSEVNRIVLPKANFIPLSIKVPLTRCDAFVQPKPFFNPVVKVNSKVQLKTNSSPALKNLFVVSKDGVKTPLTIGADGKLGAGTSQRLIMINPNKVQTAPVQGRLSRELKRLHFAAAGPKMQKISSLPNHTPLHPPRPQEANTQTIKDVAAPAKPSSPFRLGEDRGYKQYKNYFVENVLALNKYQHKEEKDKDRHVGYKFSLTGPLEFEWNGSLCGSRDDIVHTLRSALFSLEQQVPLCFMHCRWEQYRKMWGRMLVQNNSVKAFAVVLGLLEMAIRSNAKKTVWNEGLGQVRLRRLKPLEKEQYEKHKKYKSKVHEDIVQRNAIWCKYPLPVHIALVSKIRGEEYRVSGYGGWMWLSSTFKAVNRAQPAKTFTLCKETSDDAEVAKLLNSSDVIDVSRNLLIRSVLYNKRWSTSKIDKLLRWRILQEKQRIKKIEGTKKSDELIEENPRIPETTEISDQSPPITKTMKTSNQDPQLDPTSTSKVNSSITSTTQQPEIEDVAMDEPTVTTNVQKNHVITHVSNHFVTSQANVGMTSDCQSTERKVDQDGFERSPSVVEQMDVTIAPTSTINHLYMDSSPTVAGNKQSIKNIKFDYLEQPSSPKAQSVNKLSCTKAQSFDEPSSPNVQSLNEPASLKVQSFDEPSSPKVQSLSEPSSPTAQSLSEPSSPKVQSFNEPSSLKVLSVNEPLSPKVHSLHQTSSPKVHSLNESSSPKVQSVNEPSSPKAQSLNEPSSPTVQSFNEPSSPTVQSLKPSSPTVQSLLKPSSPKVPTHNEPSSPKVQSLNKPSSPKVQSLDEPSSPKIHFLNEPSSPTSFEQPSSPKVHSFEQPSSPNAQSFNEPSSPKFFGQPSSPKSVEQSSSPKVHSVEQSSLPEVQSLKETSSPKTRSVEQPSSPKVHSVEQSSSPEVQSLKETSSPKTRSVEQPSSPKVHSVELPVAQSIAASSETNHDEMQMEALASVQSSAQPSSFVTQNYKDIDPHNARTFRISRRYRKKDKSKTRAVQDKMSGLAKVWKLKKPPVELEKKKSLKMPFPWIFASKKEKRRSIFRLPKLMIRHMVTRGGLAWYPLGFRHVQKNPTSLELFWPYRCVRPTIGTVWRFKLQNAKTLATIAHLLRLLWHSMRWEDIVTKPSTDDVIHTIFNDDEIISIELLKRRDVGSSGLRSEYFVRRIVMPSSDYDEEIPRSEAYTPSSRSGLRARSRQMNLRERTKKDWSVAQPKVQTLWLPEDQVELWQIRQFDAMIRQQQKAALARKEADAKEAERKAQIVKQRLAREAEKQVTITPALLQQATALHRSQTTPATSKIISVDISQMVAAGLTSSLSGNKITLKSSNVFSPLTSGRLGADVHITQQTAKMLPKKILVKPASNEQLVGEIKAKHPTIKLSGIVGSPKTISTAQVTTGSRDPVLKSAQQNSRSTASMQVKLSSAQLGDLMKVGFDTVVKVSINLPDGSPGTGHLQVIPPGTEITPGEGQQLMQCKVGNEVRRFLLTASNKTLNPTSATMTSYPGESEVTLETPSLRHRLEQLQHRQQELIKPALGGSVHRLMTDKDPLWGGRSSEKPPAVEKNVRNIERVKKKYSVMNENREDRQRRNVVQHVIKSMLDRIEKKEEVEAKKRKREEREEQQKRRRESMDIVKSQQRMQSRLFQVLLRHEEQLKQEIRKRRTITEKYLTHIAQNELHEDRVKKRRTTSGNDQRSPPKPAASHVLSERNNRESLQKRNKRKNSPEPLSPPNKKRKMLTSSSELYCTCQTPYDESKFYIGCDLCMNWFHGNCVGISERKAKQMDTWVCRDCQKTTPQEELYCLCKTPYDDSQFYIGCDVCQDWFHGRCVGIDESKASDIGSYTCPRCRKLARDATQERSLSGKELTQLMKIVRHLQNHKMAWPFLEPVRESDAPGYYKVVTRPMDLQTVMKRLQGRYYTKLSELVGDVSLIFDNCRQFNGPESNLVRCAEIVETVFVGRIRDMRGR